MRCLWSHGRPIGWVAGAAIVLSVAGVSTAQAQADHMASAPAVPSAMNPPAPSSDALALSRAIAAQTPPSQTSPDPATVQFRLSIANDLLRSWHTSRGAPCAREVAECQEAADLLAREAAPQLVAYHLGIRVISRAVYFDATMTREEMIEARRVLETPTGQVLARALLTMANSIDWSPDVRERVGMATLAAQAENPPVSSRTLADRFYDMTTALPRAIPPRVAPPPR